MFSMKVYNKYILWYVLSGGRVVMCSGEVRCRSVFEKRYSSYMFEGGKWLCDLDR